MELSSIPDPQAKWAKAMEVAELAETLGYDSIWAYDHFHNVPFPAHETMFECWTTLAAISQRTSRLRLGQMVGCAPYRSPALLAKITSNIDVMSGGRLDWGIGAGWYEHEFNGYGYEFKNAKERIGVLRETVEIVKSMWSEPDTTYEGKYFRLKGAQCDPKPVQQPHPPIWIGGGEQPTLRVVCVADRSNWRHARASHTREVPKGHRRSSHALRRDRERGHPRCSWRERKQEIIDGGTRSFFGEPFESCICNLVGTPEQVAEGAGVRRSRRPHRFVPWCSDIPDTESMRLLAEKVIPNSAGRDELDNVDVHVGPMCR
jgi:alkanesulfonate monooxygenase SsuD/methylene tetrahydromethanopterin reductase-like flavin-dependent oxidoreductase (luciferase family)